MTARESVENHGSHIANIPAAAIVDATDPSCQVADGQRVWFVEGAEPADDRLLLTDERTGHQLVVDHDAWNSLIAAVAYFQKMHCEACPDVSLDAPDDFELVPGVE